MAVSTANAQSLSLDEAQRLALDVQPLASSYQRGAAAAREAAVAERELADPRLRFGVANVPVTGDDAFRLNRDDQTMLQLGVTQDVMRKAKREALGAREDAQARAMSAEGSESERRIQREVAFAWLDASAAAQRARLLTQTAEEVRAERAVMSARIPSAGADVRELTAIDAMGALVEDQRVLADREQRKARTMLARWIGPAAERPFAEPPPLGEAAQRLAARFGTGKPDALDAHPTLAAARATEEAARAEVQHAHLQSDRDWSWELMYGKRTAGRSDMVSVLFTFPILLDKAQRQDRHTAEKQLNAERAQLLALDRARSLLAEARAAAIDFEAAGARAENFRQRVWPAATARVEAALSAYRSGRGTYAQVAEARRLVIDAGLQRIEIDTERLKAAAALRYFE